MRKLYLGILIAGALCCSVAAQSAVAVATPANPGFVDKLIADAYPYIMAALGTLVTTILAWASVLLKGWLDRDKAKGKIVEARQAVTDGVSIVNEEKWKLKANLSKGSTLPPAVAQKLEDKALDIAARILHDNADPKATLDVLSPIEQKAAVIQAVEATNPAAVPAVDAPAPVPPSTRITEYPDTAGGGR